MDLIEISKRIEDKEQLLIKWRKSLDKYGDDMAEGQANYDLKLGTTLMALRNDREFELEGEKIKNPPVSIMDKVAKGICWKEKLEMSKTENLYRNAQTKMRAIQGELNALQTIHKHLD